MLLSTKNAPSTFVSCSISLCCIAVHHASSTIHSYSVISAANGQVRGRGSSCAARFFAWSCAFCCCPGPSCHAATSAELQAVQRAVPPSLFIQVVPQQWQEHLPTLSSSMVKSLCACTAGVVSLDVYLDTIRSQVMHTTCACMGDCISVCVTRSCCNAELADTSLCQIGRRQPHMAWLLTLKSTLVCGSLISAVCTGL